MAERLSAWLDFAIQQIGAESYLDGFEPADPGNRGLLIQRLRLGNSRSEETPTGTTRLTPEQASAFIARYRIVDHHSNDGSGFSATVLFDTRSNRYTLAFRSTESARRENGGDFERDAQGGASSGAGCRQALGVSASEGWGAALGDTEGGGPWS